MTSVPGAASLAIYLDAALTEIADCFAVWA